VLDNTSHSVDRVVSPREVRAQKINPDCVLVWGRKSNTQKALKFAAKHGVPVQYLEDGWIRSSAANPHSRTCYSILNDKSGVYYDSRTPNDLENLLNLDDSLFNKIVTPEGIAYARRCREKLVRHNISKYNFTSQKAPVQRDPQKQQVLVVDQTYGDASIIYGGMDASDFEHMLHAAISENPDAQITVRIHPDVVSGRRRGYLKQLAVKLGVGISADAVNPLLMLKQFDKVYVGTSQLGFEALLCDKPVVVFGQPFYSGWGVSDDRSLVPRRIRKRSIDELFYASYIVHARYCNPVTGQSWQLHECLDHVELQLNMFSKNAMHFDCNGITAWKRQYIRQYLRSPDGSEVAQSIDGQPLFRVEDGFLRSMGLGSDFNAPASLVVDRRGLYLDPARPSDLEALLSDYDCAPAEILRAVSLKKLPDAWIRYKPHPDVVAGNRTGAIDERVLQEKANAVDADASIIDCIEACDELHTMTSLSGFEALIRGKRVVTYGAPFYAGWGLSEDHQPIARRTRRRTLDELVYLSLIAYPRYVDIETGEFTTRRISSRDCDMRRDVLLLQGPIGPFFSRLAEELVDRGFNVHKVNLNGGDKFFYSQPGAIDYSGKVKHWDAFLERLIVNKNIGRVYLFGDCRIYHRIAREVAHRHNVRVFVFEEGYIRPNFITLEENGVNGHSAMVKKNFVLPKHVQPTKEEKTFSINVFSRVAIYAIVYYWASKFRRRLFPNYQHHRDFRLVSEGYRWVVSGVRKLRFARKERHVLQNLLPEFEGNYFVCPLQVHCDMQVVVHSNYNSIEHFIGDVLTSFAKYAPSNKAIVFKHHPLDRGYTDYTNLFNNLVSELGLQGRVLYVHDLCLPTLLKHAQGTVVINSTVGMSSLFHGTPVKTLGKAIYNLTGITCQSSLKAFWRNSGEVDRDMFQHLRNYLVVENQLNGNMYKVLRGESASGLVWSDRLLAEHSYTEERIDSPANLPRLRIVAGLDMNPVVDDSSEDSKAA